MPFRDNPKPEQVIEFFGHALSEAFEQTDCVYKANVWLTQMAGQIDIVHREVFRNMYGKCVDIVIWYRYK